MLEAVLWEDRGAAEGRQGFPRSRDTVPLPDPGGDAGLASYSLNSFVLSSTGREAAPGQELTGLESQAHWTLRELQRRFQKPQKKA